MRRAPDDGPVIGTVASDDEELGPLPAGWSKALAAALAVGVGLLVTVAVVNHRSRPPHPRVAAAPTASSAPPAVVAEPVDMGLRVALRSSPEQCPSTIRCRTGRLPAQAVAALHRLLPAAVVHSRIAVTQTNPRRIYFRQLHATAATMDILVRVVRSNILDGLEATERTWTSPAHRYAFVRVITSDEYEVEVQLSVPLADHPPLGLARRLAADSALLAPDAS